MKKEEVRKLLEENFEEISVDEYDLLLDVGELCVHSTDGTIYFKPKEKYPKIFEDTARMVVVYKSGTLVITDKISRKEIIFNDSLPVLYEAVELSKKLRDGKKENRG